MALNKESLERLWQHIIARLGQKVDKEDGKGLSSCDFTKEEKEKLKSLETNVRADWNETNPDSASYIVNAPFENENAILVEWDGVVKDGMVSFSDNGRTYYKISDYSNTNIDDLSMVTVCINGQAQSVPVNYIAENATSPDGMTIIASTYFFIFPTSWTSESIVVPEKGVYSLKSQSIYIEKLTGKIHVIKESAISSKIARLTDLPCGEFDEAITWDGSKDGRDMIEFSGSTYYKVSDRIITPEVLLEQSVDVYQNGVLLGTVPLSQLGIDSSTIDNGYYGCEAVVVITDEQYLVSQGQSVSKGIYFFVVDDDQYVGKLTMPAEIKQIEDRFIPDTIARVDDLPIAITSERITEICGIAPEVTFVINEIGDATIDIGYPDENGNIQI